MTRKISYGSRACRWCQSRFVPASSRQKHCCAGCRFTEKAWECRTPSGCWEWLDSVNIVTGYGQFMKSTSPVKLVTAHRMSWELYRGGIPDGLLVLHKCDNRKCFNPDHLFLGTYKDNAMDKIKKGRDNAEGRVAGLLAAWARKRARKDEMLHQSAPVDGGK